MSAGEVIADRARALLGVPFRLHGRAPASGLDCVGVVLAALDSGAALPPYTMRRTALEPFDRIAREHDLIAAEGEMRAGDVLVLHVGPAQLHAAIADGAGGIVHAHAALRRVVHGPLPPDWIVVQHWRINPR